MSTARASGAPARTREAAAATVSRRQLLFGATAPPLADDPSMPPRDRLRRLGWVLFALAALFSAWLIGTTPFARALHPVERSGLLVVAADGTPIARRGAIVDAPVDAGELPAHVTFAFLAAEDRRFLFHHGIDPRALLRAALRNAAAGGVREGGSTITQQLARLAALESERTALRKLREMLLAVWIEVVLPKEEILSRYLSAAYFGDNVYGLRAAAHHYFNRPPERLTVEQAALLAGLVNAPSRLAPTSNLEGARSRARRVIESMARNGWIDSTTAAALPDASLQLGPVHGAPGSSWFVDWAIGEAAEAQGGRVVHATTLDPRLQRLAERAVARARLGSAQAALVAMRPDGRVVAMVGGRDYRESPYNRAAQARRQPGSAFKIFVYLAAIRRGAAPDAIIADVPIAVGDWEPSNHGDDYRGFITLREAFAHSSNSAAVQLSEWAGREQVIAAARDLGVTGELVGTPSLALGTPSLSLMEMTAAFAGIAGNRFPVRPWGRADAATPPGRLSLDPRERAIMLDLLWSAANEGTGRAAALSTATFGKTGTSQGNRDAWFVGFADDLVVGVWMGRDDNSPLRGVSGGGQPASIWRSFMASALGERAAAVRSSEAERPAATPSRASPSRERSGWRDERRGRGKAKGRRGRGRG